MLVKSENSGISTFWMGAYHQNSYIDHKGNFVIEPGFEYARDFENEVALATQW